MLRKVDVAFVAIKCLLQEYDRINILRKSNPSFARGKRGKKKEKDGERGCNIFSTKLAFIAHAGLSSMIKFNI